MIKKSQFPFSCLYYSGICWQSAQISEYEHSKELGPHCCYFTGNTCELLFGNHYSWTQHVAPAFHSTPFWVVCGTGSSPSSQRGERAEGVSQNPKTSTQSQQIIPLSVVPTGAGVLLFPEVGRAGGRGGKKAGLACSCHPLAPEHGATGPSPLWNVFCYCQLIWLVL